jgi:hypothetical protein
VAKGMFSTAEIAVWWEGSLSVACYQLQELTGKSTVINPSRLLPQASPIICSCASDDGDLLALGLQSGTVVVWDVGIGESPLRGCRGVFSHDIVPS